MNKKDLFIKDGILISHLELKIVSKQVVEPKGRYVNPRVETTVSWNVKNSNSLSVLQRKKIMKSIPHLLNKKGVITTSSVSVRSPKISEEFALKRLAQIINQIL